MGRTLLLIGIGGFLGSIARYLTSLLGSKLWSGVFPFGTFLTNIIGCLFIGFIFGLSQKYGWLTPQWRFFLATGFCGGYTTFSTFVLDNAKLLQTGQYWPFIGYTFLSIAVGIFLVFTGILLAKYC